MRDNVCSQAFFIKNIKIPTVNSNSFQEEVYTVSVEYPYSVYGLYFS